MLEGPDNSHVLEERGDGLEEGGEVLEDGCDVLEGPANNSVSAPSRGRHVFERDATIALPGSSGVFPDSSGVFPIRSSGGGADSGGDADLGGDAGPGGDANAGGEGVGGDTNAGAGMIWRASSSPCALERYNRGGGRLSLGGGGGRLSL